MEGGTRVTLTGEGFSANTTHYDIKIGNSVCQIDTVSPTRVTCMSPMAGQIHVITNNGIHPCKYKLCTLKEHKINKI